MPQERECCVELMEMNGNEACILASWQAHEQYACCRQSAEPGAGRGTPDPKVRQLPRQTLVTTSHPKVSHSFISGLQHDRACPDLRRDMSSGSWTERPELLERLVTPGLMSPSLSQ